MNYNTLLTTILLLALSLNGMAQEAADTEEMTFDTTGYSDAFRAYQDSVQQTLTFYSDTTLSIADGMAWLTVPEGYSFIGQDDARTVLVEMWGNPPENGEGSLGMLFPDKYPPASSGGYGIDIFYTEDGYIDDEDAVDMDYDDLLESMQDDTDEESEARLEAGYERIKLMGWAQTPRYDATNKRLHWAKEFRFGDDGENTLNYNMLFLGRRGYLTMNVIGGMDVLGEVNADQEEFLNAVAYQDGHRYADFNPEIDDVAAYGIGALIAGKILAKTGLLATIGIFLAKGWKLIMIALLAVGGGLKKFFGGK